MDEPTFEFTAGDLSLDFANAWRGRLEASTDPDRSFAQLVAWAIQGGVLAPSLGHRLVEVAGSGDERAAASLRRAAQLREAIDLAFSRVAGGRPPSDEELSTINRILAEALPHLRLRAGKGRCRWECLAPPDALDQMLWPVARSAAELLTSDRVDRVRECASDTCAWLFLDRSRNGRRKWCDMASCGNRAKARRYYARHRSG
jgi:predicted RNA-binding Zn ribbon-like protein